MVFESQLLKLYFLFYTSFFNWLILIFVRQHTAPCKLHSGHYALFLHLQIHMDLDMYPSYYMYIEQWTLHAIHLY